MGVGVGYVADRAELATPEARADETGLVMICPWVAFLGSLEIAPGGGMI